MPESTYHENPDFAATMARITHGVHPGRLRALRVCVHSRDRPKQSFDAISTAADYVRFLKLCVDDMGRFELLTREQARAACASVAEYELLMGERQMPRDVALALADAWLLQFDDGAAFLASNSGILHAPPKIDGPPGLFLTDVAEGVVAASPSRAGLFWNAENS